MAKITDKDNVSRYVWDSSGLGGADGQDESNAKGADTSPVKVGFIGVGNMGSCSLESLLDDSRAVVTALCDCDRTHLERAADRVKEKTGRNGFHCFSDFRELNRCDDVDTVIISTPDHWHALQGIDAMRNGKDVYIEKPLTLRVSEGRDLCRVAKETGRITQTGTQQRSSEEFRFGCELVRNGKLGQIREVNLSLPPNNHECPPAWEPMPVPPELDYDMWLGPALEVPYHEQRCHYTFRFISDYSGGQLTNWGAHHLDIVQWALGTEHSGPTVVSGSAKLPGPGLFDVPVTVDVQWLYPNDVRVSASTGLPSRIEFIGTEGRLELGRRRIQATPESLLETRFGDNDVRLIHSANHYHNFFDAVRSRRQTISPVEVGHRSATVCHMANIAILLGRPLEWDPQAEQFLDDSQANAMLRPERRPPWDEIV